MFRLGLVQLHAHTGAWKSTPLPARTCAFCKRVNDRMAVEDAYHVCIECPLYEHLRVRLYRYLSRQGFDASSVRHLQDMFVALLSVGAPPFVRAVGRFLVDCLFARDVYLGHKSGWRVMSRGPDIMDCVARAPTSCRQSLAMLLHMQPSCDITFSRPLSELLLLYRPVGGMA